VALSRKKGWASMSLGTHLTHEKFLPVMVRGAHPPKNFSKQPHLSLGLSPKG